MATMIEGLGERLAQRIRNERLARGWSPAELARRSGVSRAMIDKVEAGLSSPTAMLLGRLSGAFEMSMSMLLARAESGIGSRLIRFNEQAIWRDPATGYLRRQVLPSPGSPVPVEVVQGELPPGTVISYPAASYAFIRQFIWVLSGELTFVEGETVHAMSGGDALELGPPQDCRFENRSDQVCRYGVILLRLKD